MKFLSGSSREAAPGGIGNISDAPSPQKVRDALVDWFVEEAMPQVKKGLRFTSGRVTDDEARRVARKRAQGFFQGLQSTYDRPTLKDLAQVKSRMDGYLHGKSRSFPYSMLLS